MIVIKHWKIHNYIRSDRLLQTLYPEKNQIVEKNSKAYTFKAESSVSGQPADYQRLPQESIVQSKLGQSQGSSSENDCLKMIYHFYEENSCWPQKQAKILSIGCKILPTKGLARRKHAN